jgi:hypothetical protein
MVWLRGHARAWRTAALALFVVSICGPWAFDLIDIPAGSACAPPNIRLEGPSCGLPLPGLWLLAALSADLFYPLAAISTGSLSLVDWIRSLVVAIALALFLLPFLTTLVLAWKKDTGRWWWTIHLAGWSAALLFAILLVAAGLAQLHPALWGIWLYRLLAPAVLALELATRRQKKPAAAWPGSQGGEEHAGLRALWSKSIGRIAQARSRTK